MFPGRIKRAKSEVNSSLDFTGNQVDDANMLECADNDATQIPQDNDATHSPVKTALCESHLTNRNARDGSPGKVSKLNEQPLRYILPNFAIDPLFTQESHDNDETQIVHDDDATQILQEDEATHDGATPMHSTHQIPTPTKGTLRRARNSSHDAFSNNDDGTRIPPKPHSTHSPVQTALCNSHLTNQNAHAGSPRKVLVQKEPPLRYIETNFAIDPLFTQESNEHPSLRRAGNSSHDAFSNNDDGTIIPPKPHSTHSPGQRTLGDSYQTTRNSHAGSPRKVSKQKAYELPSADDGGAASPFLLSAAGADANSAGAMQTTPPYTKEETAMLRLFQQTLKHQKDKGPNLTPNPNPNPKLTPSPNERSTRFMRYLPKS